MIVAASARHRRGLRDPALHAAHAGDQLSGQQWYFDPATKLLYADFGGTLAAGDPNAADVSVLFDSHTHSNAQMVLLMSKGHDYLHFVGLTIRASSWASCPRSTAS